jgi:iron(III) transport system permease protein
VKRRGRLAASLDALLVADVFVGLFLLAFLIAPLAVVIADSVGFLRGGIADIGDFVGHLLRLTRNSVVLAVFVTVTTVGLGTLLAIATERIIDERGALGSRSLATALTLPLLAPPFVSAFATIIVFGRVGVITQILERVGIRLPDIYGFRGIAITHIMHLVPLAYLTIAAGLRTVPRAIEECAITLGSTPWQTLTRVVIPYISSYISMAALLVFLASFGDVGAPLLVGGQYLVLPTEAFTRFISFAADRRVPILLSGWIIVCSSVILVLVRAVMRRGVIVSQFTATTYTYDVAAWRRVITAGAWAVSLALLVPYGAILVSSFAQVWGPELWPRIWTGAHYSALWRSVGPLRTTLLVALIGTPVAVIAALMIGRRVRQAGAAGAVLDYLTLLPFVTSGVVMGIGLSRLASPLEHAGVIAPFVTGPGLLIAALVSRRLSYPVRVLNAGFSRIDRSLEESSWSLGASPARTFALVTLPQLYPALAAAATIACIELVRELGTTLIIYRPGWATLAVQIYAYANEGQLGRASAVSIVLLVLVAAATAIGNRFAGRSGADRGGVAALARRGAST